MVVAASREVASAEHFLVLNVRAGNRQNLGAEAEFAKGAIFVFHRELAVRIASHEIHLAGRKVCDVRRPAEAKAV